MLKKDRVLSQLKDLTPKVFSDKANELELAKKIWLNLLNNPEKLNLVKIGDFEWPIPEWIGGLNDFKDFSPLQDSYKVIAVDGSQIYPDRHQGIPCFLLNVGSVQLTYKTLSRSNVQLYSEPSVVFLDENLEEEINSGICKFQKNTLGARNRIKIDAGKRRTISRSKNSVFNRWLYNFLASRIQRRKTKN